MNLARTVLLLWSILLPAGALLMPAGYWTIDDGLKALAARTAAAPWSTPIPDGEMRSRLSNPADYPALVPPFAERLDSGYAPGFTPGARFMARIENVVERRGLVFVTALIAVAMGWILYAAGLSWGFLLLPLTFYGWVPWEHGLAFLLSLPLLIGVFMRQRMTMRYAILSGTGLALAAVLRMEYVLLALAAMVALLLARRYRDALDAGGAAIVTAGLVVYACSAEELLRSWELNRLTASPDVLQSAYNTLFSLGPSPVTSFGAVALLLLSLWQLTREQTPRVLKIVAWGGIALFAVYAVRIVWHQALPPLALLQAGSIAFAMPWVLWLLIQRPVWKQKAMTFAIALLVLSLFLVPQSQGVHWGPRLLLYCMPIFLIALYQAKLHLHVAFGALLLVSAAQSVSAATLVYARYVESTEHIQRLTSHIGSPLVTTTRAHAIDLAPLWEDHEFFVAATPSELRSLLTEFYMQRLDSAWLHLRVDDSLFIQTFPQNKPVWPHRMTIVNSGTFYKTQWRIFQLVMNRADSAWVPLLEDAAGKAVQIGDEKRALFLQNDVVTLTPNNASAHSNFALILARMGKTYDAQKAVARALDLDSTLTQAQELARQLGLPEAVEEDSAPARN